MCRVRPVLDEAMRRQLPMVGFLTQPMHESQDYSASCEQLQTVLS